MTASVDAPTYDADIYDDHSLLDPYEHYWALRYLGPAGGSCLTGLVHGIDGQERC